MHGVWDKTGLTKTVTSSTASFSPVLQYNCSLVFTDKNLYDSFAGIKFSNGKQYSFIDDTSSINVLIEPSLPYQIINDRNNIFFYKGYYYYLNLYLWNNLSDKSVLNGTYNFTFNFNFRNKHYSLKRTLVLAY